jgi:hypothetical protein
VGAAPRRSRCSGFWSLVIASSLVGLLSIAGARSFC